MEWESDSPCPSHTYPGQGLWSPGRLKRWELEFRDYGAIPGWGLLLTAERWVEGMWGMRSWWEMLVEESQAATEARQHCWVTWRGWRHHHSLSSPTGHQQQLNNRELAHQMPDALSYRGAPHPGAPVGTGALDQPRGVGWVRDGREFQMGGDICIPMADSCWGLAENSKIL